jgi:hypothetical protein
MRVEKYIARERKKKRNKKTKADICPTKSIHANIGMTTDGPLHLRTQGEWTLFP